MSISRETKIGWAIAAVIGVIIIGVGLIRQNARQRALPSFDDFEGATVTPPDAFLRDSTGDWQALMLGDYCWAEETSRACVTGPWPPVGRLEISVAEGEPLEVRFDAVPPEVTLALYADSEGQVAAPVLSTTLTPDSAELSWVPDIAGGTYLFAATWQESEEKYARYVAWVTLSGMGEGGSD